jgi:PilZ domain
MAFHDRSFHRSIEDLRPWAARESRYVVAAPTTIMTAKGAADATVVNLSNGGCRIRSAMPLRSGERLSLVVEPLGMVDAEVRWTDDGDAGLKLIGRDPYYGDYRLYYLP